MATENMTDQAQTATPATAAASATANQGVQDTTLKNGWGTSGTLNPAQAASAPPATSPPAPAASPDAAAAPSTDAAAPAAAEQAAPTQDAAAQAAAAQVDGSSPAPHTENREQLHRRVQSRIAELEEARDQLAGKDSNKARASAIETELQVARNAMSGGWEHVGPLEASHLSQWLTNTSNLIVP